MEKKALIVNANNKEQIVQAIKQALEMPVEEQIERNRLMQERLSRYTVSRWSHDFISALIKIKEQQQKLSVRKLSKSAKEQLIKDYKASKSRLFLLDYDGTLASFKDRPEKAGPDKETLNLIKNLSSDNKNEIAVISGRDKQTLEQWLGFLNVGLVAEHGGWFRRKGQDWQCIKTFEGQWKETIRPVLELYADRTPGALVEEKDFSLVWHYRRASPELAHVRVQELKDTLMNMTANLDVGVFEGSKIIEVKHLGINKGRAAELWISQQNWGFLLAAGDDYTDEEMFAVLPAKAHSIRVGFSMSKARFNVDSVDEVKSLLKELAGD